MNSFLRKKTLLKPVVLVFMKKSCFIILALSCSIALSYLIFWCYGLFAGENLEKETFNEMFKLLFFEVLYPLLCLLITFLAYVCVVLMLFGKKLAVCVCVYVFGVCLIMIGFSASQIGRSLMLVIPSAMIVLIFGLKILLDDDR
ncbi:MAG: hypothetical protein LBD14_02360 [Puniceicoccales bacterium]|jgi:hypothetical protein|nr:hypothetical protein [Puniceicoccales bacterium]